MPITLERANFRVTVLPEQGGKVTELYHRRLDRNLLLPRLPTADLPLADGAVFSVAGWDECIPSVDASLGVLRLGYAWRTTPVCLIDENKLLTNWEMPGWRLEREMIFAESMVTSRCIIMNMGSNDAPLLWAGHVLLPLDGLREVTLPAGDLLPGPECDIEDLAKNRLSGNRNGWNIVDIRRRDLNWKFFLPAGNPVVLHYNDASLTMTTDTGWWGIWLNEGGLCDQLCIGVEPTNVPSDALADSQIFIPPDGVVTVSWSLKVSC